MATLDEQREALVALYNWVRRNQEQMLTHEGAFAQLPPADHNRLAMSFAALGTSLDIRLKAQFPKRPAGGPTASRPQDRPPTPAL